MASKDFGDNLIAFAAYISWIGEQLRSAEQFTMVGPDNPAYKIVMEIATQVLPIFKSHSPVLTGLLRQSHIIGDSGMSGGGSHVTAFAEIIIDPNAPEHSIYHGTFPKDYGPEYHQEKRQWFLEARHEALPLFDQIVADQFKVFLEIFAF